MPDPSGELVERLEALHVECRRWVYESGLGDSHEPSRLLRLARDITTEAAAALSRAEAERDLLGTSLQAIVRAHTDYGDDEFETIARALCKAGGGDPDALVAVNDGPTQRAWRQFLPEATLTHRISRDAQGEDK